MQINELYPTLNRLSYITRYAGEPHIFKENVAEHSFYVASIVALLHEKYSFNMSIALQMAVTHDWPEALCGDVLSTIKGGNAKLKYEIQQAEFAAAKDIMTPEQYRLYVEYEQQASKEAKIVKYADILQCKYYAEKEVSLGNTNMQRVVDDTVIKLGTYEELIECMKR